MTTETMPELTIETIDDKIVVIFRENGQITIKQDFNNNTGQPFADEAEAQAYIDAYLAPVVEGSPE